MIRTMLKSKISSAKITDSNLFYEGSIGIDLDILEQSNIKPNEQVQIVNLNNGERLITYAIKAPRGSKSFVLNGPAARKGLVGDEIMIISYCLVEDAVIDDHQPIIINLNADAKNT
jgi:aspartate 1-decarboxylase